MRKEKYLQVFNYLWEFSKLRNSPVRDIEASTTNYPEVLWFSDIPEDKLISCVTQTDFDKVNNDFWLKVYKPIQPIKPKFTKPPQPLDEWIDHDSLLNEDSEPQLNNEAMIGGVQYLLNDFPKVQNAFVEYVNGDWLDELVKYKELFDAYEIENERYFRIASIYQKLFNLYNKVQQFGEEYELVVGAGLLYFKANDSAPLIRRHAFSLKVDIEFRTSVSESFVSISANQESIIQVESDSILDLNSIFDPTSIVDAENSAMEILKQKEVLDNPFDEKSLEAYQSFVDRISSKSIFIPNVIYEKELQESPALFFAPALILRKRNTRSLTALYETIINDIKEADDTFDISPLNDLIEELSDNGGEYIDEVEINKAEKQQWINPDTIFFPKKYNDEQIEIVLKSSKNDKVLVQGPPGTGKSHTIANLICHLLANGKRILVTAYSKRALEVLKDKLPDEFKSLVVNLLSGDASSIQDLKSSVNGINDELSKADINQLKNEIKSLEAKLVEIRKIKAKTFNEIISEKESSVSILNINSKYSGTPLEVAEKVEKDDSLYSWYVDEYSDISNISFVDDIKAFIDLKNNYDGYDQETISGIIPDLELLPTIDSLFMIKNICKEIEGYDLSDQMVKADDYVCLLENLNRFQELFFVLNNSPLFFIGKIKNDYKNLNLWVERLATIKVFLDKYSEEELIIRDKTILIKYPLDSNLVHLKNDAQFLLSFLKEGNRLEGVKFFASKMFLPQNTKEKLYFINAVRVGNNSACDTIEEFETVIFDIDLQQDLLELEHMWGEAISTTTYPQTKGYVAKYKYFNQLFKDVTKAIEITQEIASISKTVSLISSINVDIVSITEFEIVKIIKNTYISKLKKEELVIRSSLNKSIQYLQTTNLHPLASDFLKAIVETNIDLFTAALDKRAILFIEKSKISKYFDLRMTLSQNFPVLVSQIDSNTFDERNLNILLDAILHRHARNKIKKHLVENTENILSNKSIQIENEEFSCIKVLGAKKAWCKVLENLTINRSLRKHLDAWVLAVRNIGKTGVGPRAIKFRKEAQTQMEHCKDSVPCWIMPLYKVAETVYPTKGMYDYIIIDEASQLGPDAIFLLYLSKKIIIVGDDKQTSPEYVGVSATQMDPFIRKHLSGIPFANFYGTTTSFFDHAKLFCEGMIVLREHFRCMPEIIEFSNKYFYAPDGKCLFPLKQYSENRLEPLQHVFCPEGYVEGRSQQICNRVEAEKIVEKILELIVDDRYKDKTFGVISLQGTQQPMLIESLLLQKIGETEYIRRKILCGNSTSFQGDERDVMLLSLVTAHNHQRAAFTKREDDQRFNVAVSRAKEQVWLFHSVQLEDLSNKEDLRYKILDHFLNYKENRRVNFNRIDRRLGSQPEPFESWFEVDVHNDIVDKGYSVIPQYEVVRGKYRIDLVVLLKNGVKIAIECDGDKWHGPEQIQSDMLRERFLTRIEGWQFFRVRGAEYYSNRVKSLETLWVLLEKNSKNNDKKVSNESKVKQEDYDAKENRYYPEKEESNLPNLAEGIKNNELSTEGSKASDINQIFEKPKILYSKKESKLEDIIDHVQESLFENIEKDPKFDLPTDSKVWFALSHWGKENNTLYGPERSIAYNYGKFLATNREISEKLLKAATKIYIQSVTAGFVINDGVFSKPISLKKNSEDKGLKLKEQKGGNEVLPKDEIIFSIVSILKECPNQTATKDSMASRILKKHKIDIRGDKRADFERRVSRIIASLKTSGQIEVYKSKNTRIRLLYF